MAKGSPSRRRDKHRQCSGMVGRWGRKSMHFSVRIHKGRYGTTSGARIDPGLLEYESDRAFILDGKGNCDQLAFSECQVQRGKVTRSFGKDWQRVLSGGC